MKTNRSAQVFALFFALILGLKSVPTLAVGPIQSIHEAQIVIREVQSSCPMLNCPEARAVVEKLSPEQIEALPEATLEFLRIAARSYAEQIWPDTVLESEYHVEFRPRVEALDRLTIDGEFVGYRLSFSSVAWNLHECPAFSESEVKEKGLARVIKEKCPRGRLNDQAFILTKIPGSFDDEMSYTHFDQELK